MPKKNQQKMQANSLAHRAREAATATHEIKKNVKLRLLACTVLESILASNAMTV